MRPQRMLRTRISIRSLKFWSSFRLQLGVWFWFSGRKFRFRCSWFWFLGFRCRFRFMWFRCSRFRFWCSRFRF